MVRVDRCSSLLHALLLLALVPGCASLFGHKSAATAESTQAEPASEADTHVAVSMPHDPTEVRDDRSAPIVKVAMAGSVVFPYIYGYPIYPEGDAARGISTLRSENWNGAHDNDKEDDSGVVHEVEELPVLGCRFDGIRENAIKFVPLSLTCELPAPRALGGSRRPVLGKVTMSAKADQLLKDPSVQEAFLGAFHLTTDGFDSGSGTGYFNTTHGQLAFVYSHKKLTRFVYYFDPGVKGWQNPALWVKP